MNANLQDTLLDLFHQVIDDPDRIPAVPIDSWQEGSEERQLLKGFRDMLERLHQRQQDKLDAQERFSLAVQGANDGLWDWHVQTNEYHVSPRWKSMLGYEEHEIPDTVWEWPKRLHPDDVDRMIEAGRAYIDGETDSYEHEYRMLHKDGSYRWIFGRATALRDASGKAYRLAGSNTDITERIQAEEQLREREEQYRSIFEASTDGLLIIDLEDSRAVEVNPVACQMFGYTREEMLGRPIGISDDTQQTQVHAREVIRVGGLFQMREITTRKDGTSFYAEVHASPFTYKGKPHMLAIVRDITERVEAEQQLREREEQYRSIFEATYDGLNILDLDGFFVEVNPAFCSMFGYTREELIGMHASVTTAPETLSLLDDILKTFKAGRSYQTVVAKALRKDGTTFYAEAQGTPLIYKGQPHTLGVVRDVTEQVQAQQLLEQRVEERTRELSTLLEVSHNVASAIELKPLVDLILEQLKVVVDYTGSAITILENEDLVLVGTRGPESEDHLMQRRFPLKHMGLIWEKLCGGESVIIDNVRNDTPLAEAYREAVGDLLETTFRYVRSWVTVPLKLKDQVIGMLSASHSKPNYYTTHHADLALAIANQAAIAIENARLYGQAQELAALEERQKLARELHDSVSQALYGISLGTHAARTALERDPEHVAEPLDYVLTLAEAGLAEMRALIFELRPESLETEGLVSALSKQAAALQARHEILVSTELCDEPDLSLHVKQEFYRIAQEAMHNTVKHAHANHVELRLEQTADGVLLEVRDDGSGFDPTASFPGHLGLHSMRERVANLGGTFEIDSVPGAGTRICVCVPGRP
jgi:PAS domain S-box-containing protein